MGRFKRQVERRHNEAQRATVERLLEEARGRTHVLPAHDGSVYVYDELRDVSARGTRRIRVLATGEADSPDFLRLS